MVYSLASKNKITAFGKETVANAKVYEFWIQLGEIYSSIFIVLLWYKSTIFHFMCNQNIKKMRTTYENRQTP